MNASGQLTQAMLDDPNSFIRNHANALNITNTTTISISTQPTAPPVVAGIPQFGGGTNNVAFLLGDGNQPLPPQPNAHAIQMTATFWIETVQYTLSLPPMKPHHPPILVKPTGGLPGQPMPTFLVPPPPQMTHHTEDRNFSATQIQYSQLVLLNFATLSWPHVSVATLVPKDPIPVPVSIWA